MTLPNADIPCIRENMIGTFWWIFGSLIVGAIVCYFFGRIHSKPRYTGIVAFVFLVIAGFYLYCFYPGVKYLNWSFGISQTYLHPDSLGVFLGFVAIGLGALVSIFSMGYMEHKDTIGKFYALLLIMITGIVGIGMAGDLFNLFVFFEVMTIPSYILVAFEKEKWEPIEAAMKYIIMSAFGSLMALMGISIIFMNTGRLDLATLVNYTVDMDSMKSISAVCLIMVGFGVKAAIVPLHSWLPDAHSAAPSGISAMLSGIIIQAGLIAMIKVLAVLPGVNSGVVLIIFGIISMFVGNFIAITQKDLKRMLAYSSIAQMGYIVIGIGLAFVYPSTAGVYGIRGSFFHILNHAIIKGGAFLCAGAVIYSIGTRDLEEMRGIGQKIPIIGVAFAFFALALAGVPPLNGFISKFFICRAGIDAGGWGILATVLIILNSAISLVYYLPAINKILFSQDVSEKAMNAKKLPTSIIIPIIIMVILTVLFGIFPQLGLKLVEPVVGLMVTG